MNNRRTLKDRLMPTAIRRAMLGPTGKFPDGKLMPDDEGEIQFAIVADPETQRVIIDFGTPVTWIAFSRGDAESLAKILQEKAAMLAQIAEAFRVPAELLRKDSDEN